MKLHDRSAARKAAILAAYLGPDVDGAHQSLVRAELVELLENNPVDERILRTVLCLGDPGLIDMVLERSPADWIEEFRDLDGDRIDVFDIVSLADMQPRHRIAAFERLRPFCAMSELDLANRLMHQAMRAGDAALAEHLLVVLGAVDIHVAYLDTRLIEESDPGFAPIWKRIFEELDFARSEVSEFARTAVKQQNARAVALLMKRGFPIKPLIKAHHIGGGPWPERMRQRIESAHAEMALHASLPSLEEIARMPEKDVQVLLGGLSRKQRKQLEREERQRQQQAQQRAETS